MVSVTGVVALTLSASAALAQPTGPVSSTPADGTPTLGPYVKGATEQIRQLFQCGGTMYAVGTFNTIEQKGTSYTRNNIFSFSATAPYTITSWAPDVNGIVNSIAFNGSDCADAYIGGVFTSVNGTTVNNIAEIDTTTGDVVPTFAHSASGEVDTLLAVDGHVLVGGAFKSISNSSADPYFTSLDPTTGKNDNFLQLNISGHYSYPGISANPTKVYNQQLSHGGTLDLVEGDFTSVGGLSRQQIFMLNLATDPATVTGWSSPEWDGSAGFPSKSNPDGYWYQCSVNESMYIKAAAWSPDDSTVYIATTGNKPWNHKSPPFYGSDSPPWYGSSLCDAAAAFPATQTEVTAEWINYTGCDSLFSAAADASTAYFAGHERWASNPQACDQAGPGAVAVKGFVGLSPTTGAVTFNPTRARGLGADDMLLTDAGLWIASDNFNGAAACAHKADHSGICFLPYSS
jgi:hypothetical protein